MSGRSAPGLKAYVFAYIAFLYLPIILIPVFSFNSGVQAAFPLKGFTLDWYGSLTATSALGAALGNSLIVGLSAAGIATLCGVTISYASLFAPSRLSRVVSVLARLPILIPGVILGVALLILVNVAGFGPSRLAIILGHVLVGLPTSVVIMRSRFVAIPRSIPEAALDLGAHDATVFWRVMLPLSSAAIVSSLLLTFLTSFDEFIVAFLLSGSEPTLPVYIWAQLRFPKSLPSVMALGSLVLAVSVVLAVSAELLRRTGAGSRRPTALLPVTT